MWDLKLFFSSVELNVVNIFINCIYYIVNTVVFYQSNGFVFYHLKFTFVFNTSLIFGLKFLIIIAFLILIRGGTPRYRYDYLTKLGWLKFIGLLILIFFFSIVTFYIF